MSQGAKKSVLKKSFLDLSNDKKLPSNHLLVDETSTYRCSHRRRNRKVSLELLIILLNWQDTEASWT